METIDQITLDELKEMQNVNLCDVDEASLVDLKDVQIKKELPVEDRVADFISQIKNPYCFKIGGTVVKLKFQEDGPSCQEAFYAMVNTVR